MDQFRRPLSSAERSKARKPIPTTSMRNSLAKWGRARLLPFYATGARVFDTEMSQHPASGRPIKLVLHT